MFTENHYVPILKGKAGEFDAIAAASSLAKQAMTPLIEVTPLPWDFESDAPSKTIDQHLNNYAQKIEQSWGQGADIFLDFLQLENEFMENGGHCFSSILETCRDLGVVAIPVTGFGRSRDYQTAVCEAVETDNNGVCVRIANSDIIDLRRNPSSLVQLVQSLDSEPESTDIILDFGFMQDNQSATFALAVESSINGLPELNAWRTISVAATGMPPDSSGITSNSIEIVPRTEWGVWCSLRSSFRRVPTFADYAIKHPDHPQIDMRLIGGRIAGKIWYTLTDDWLITKGTSLRRSGYEQFQQLAEQIVAHEGFCGADFSWGDQFIVDCANGEAGTGNLTSWVKAGTNHHLEFVTNQLSTAFVA